MYTPKQAPETRICTVCRKDLSLENDFYRNKRGTHGRQSACKVCIMERQRAWLSTTEGKTKYLEYTKAHRSKPGYAAKHQTYSDTPKAKWKAYAKDAERRGLVFDFTFEEFVSRFWQRTCCYCGDALLTTGVDRLDYRKGYTISNTVPCCYVCNIMKLKMGQGEFIRKCRQIAKCWEGASLP